MSGYGLSEGDIRQLSKRSSASSINSILSEEYYSDEHTQLTPTKENLMLKDELTPENIPQEADSSPNKHLLSNYLDNLQKLSHIQKVRERLVRWYVRMERIQNNYLFSPLEVIVIDNKSISADLSNSDDDTTSEIDVEVKSNVRFFWALGLFYILSITIMRQNRMLWELFNI